MTKKAEKAEAEATEATGRGTGNSEKRIEDKRQRRTEATTVDGTESFPPPGMDLPDGGVVPAEEDESA
jgi:hypothetical protein